MRYILEQHISTYDRYVKTHSFRRVRRKFRDKTPNTEVPYRTTIRKLVKKVHAVGSFLEKKETKYHAF